MHEPEHHNAKNALIHAAGELFAEHGFDGVTVRDIAKRAHANLGSMSYHFENKEALYQEVVRCAIDITQKQDWMSIADSAPTADVSPHDLARAIIACIRVQLAGIMCRTDRPWRHKIILRELMQPTEAWNTLVEHKILPELECYTRLYRKAIPHATDFDAKIWTFTLHSHAAFYIISMGNMHRLTGADPLSEAFVESIINHVSRLMVASAGLPYPPAVTSTP